MFAPGGYAIDNLIDVAQENDFAILVASPDDTTTSRGSTSPAVRDNVILELGLFIGVLGRDRAYLLLTGDARLPSDIVDSRLLSIPSVRMATLRLPSGLATPRSKRHPQLDDVMRRHCQRAEGTSSRELSDGLFIAGYKSAVRRIPWR